MRQRYGVWVAALGAVVLVTLSCERTGDTPPEEDGYDRRAMVASLGEHVILPTYRDFQARAEALETAAAAYATAAASAEAPTEQQAVREAWRQAMALWQQAELYQVGPAGSALKVMGGSDLRDDIYSWPTVNTCRVDQELVNARYGQPGYFDTQLVNVYGLDALEYLLFYEGAENTCPSLATINTDGSWKALSAEDKRKRRAEYARAVAAHLVTDARALVRAWEPDGGNFLGQLASAGSGGTVYASSQAAVDEVFAAMFYVDLMVKDRKLAIPAGINPSCPSATCPEQLESRWAHASKQHVANNLRGFQKLFLGSAPGEPSRPGFSEYLQARGAGELAERMAAEIEAALAAVEAIPGTVDEALAQDPQKVRDAHAAVKVLTDSIKSQFVTVLNLRVPDAGAGDND